MKEIFFALIVAFLSLTPVPVWAESDTGVSLVSFAAGRGEIISKIGEPLKETQRDGLVVMWYGSLDPLKADFLYLKDGKMVMRSVSLISEQQTLSQYISKYTDPENSVLRFGSGADDPTQMTVHIWAPSGIAIQTAGYDMSSPVLRDFTFESTTLATFYQRLSPDLISNQPVTILGREKPAPQTALDTILNWGKISQNTSLFDMAVVGIFGVALILLIVVIFYHRRNPPRVT